MSQLHVDLIKLILHCKRRLPLAASHIHSALWLSVPIMLYKWPLTKQKKKSWNHFPFISDKQNMLAPRSTRAVQRISVGTEMKNELVK